MTEFDDFNKALDELPTELCGEYHKRCFQLNRVLTEEELREFRDCKEYHPMFERYVTAFNRAFEIYQAQRVRGEAGLGVRDSLEDQLKMLSFALGDKIDEIDGEREQADTSAEVAVRFINVIKAGMKEKS
jgi:hypothetical protein